MFKRGNPMTVASITLGLSGVAQADSTYGTAGFSYSGVAKPPTADKPQSKLWWNAGSWWADMWCGCG
jgi:hypothetical protein